MHVYQLHEPIDPRDVGQEEFVREMFRRRNLDPYDVASRVTTLRKRYDAGEITEIGMKSRQTREIRSAAREIWSHMSASRDHMTMKDVYAATRQIVDSLVARDL